MAHTRDSELWTFMLEFYARPGVATACLRLQETYRLDVPLFLAVLRAVALGRGINADQILTIDKACTAWRDAVIRPLRSIRTAMKAEPRMVDEEMASKLREDIKTIELRAERIEIDMLEDLLAELPPAKSPDIVENLYLAAALVLDGQAPGRAETLPTEAIVIIDSLANFVGHAR